LEEARKQYIRYLEEMRPLDEVISVDGLSESWILLETEILDEVVKFYVIL